MQGTRVHTCFDGGTTGHSVPSAYCAGGDLGRGRCRYNPHEATSDNNRFNAALQAMWGFHRRNLTWFSSVIFSRRLLRFSTFSDLALVFRRLSTAAGPRKISCILVSSRRFCRSISAYRSAICISLFGFLRAAPAVAGLRRCCRLRAALLGLLLTLGPPAMGGMPATIAVGGPESTVACAAMTASWCFRKVSASAACSMR